MRLIDADVLPRHGKRGGIVHWKDIDNAPTIEAVPVRRGQWIPNPFEPDWDYCTACRQGTKRREHGTDDGHEWVREYGYSFCPYCRADMRGEEDDQGTGVKSMGTDV